MRSRGFSLVEVIVVLAVFALLMSFGMPMYSQFMANSQIRASAETTAQAIQLARAEAMRRNTRVEVELGTGTGWTIRDVPSNETISTRSANEGTHANNVSRVITPTGATTITFNGFGMVTKNDDGSNPLTAIKFDSATLAAADSRDLCVAISTMGGVRLCDPNVGTSDTRSCGTPLPSGC
jgi:type IV fimbrial biogenesis protein FimT